VKVSLLKSTILEEIEERSAIEAFLMDKKIELLVNTNIDIR
jgi:hypothetical protein